MQLSQSEEMISCVNISLALSHFAFITLSSYVSVFFSFQYNSVNMKNKTAEEVYVEMLKPAETVTFKVQHRPDDFSTIKDVPGDGFYIRSVHLTLFIIPRRVLQSEFSPLEPYKKNFPIAALSLSSVTQSA